MGDINSAKNAAVCLENLSWQVADRVLASNPLVVIPLGAAAKEHGPHFPSSVKFFYTSSNYM